MATICAHLEGLPLGIELAAARVAAMSPTAIATRLSHLIGTAPSSRGKVDRHRSLDATVDWSYQLLDDTERRLLRCLSIFAGGFTMEAAEAVAGTAQVPDGLASLVNKSLVVYAPDTDRYHLLETVRAFALSRLRQAGEADAVARRHLGWCAAFAETVYNLYVSPGTTTEAQAFAATDQEIDNIRAAATWAAEHGDLDGLRLIGRLLGYWYYQAPVEGGSWADRVLATIPATDPVATAMVLTVQTACAAAAGDTPTALAASAAALGLLRGAGRESPLLYAVIFRGLATISLPDRTESRALYLEAYELAARIGHPFAEQIVLGNLSILERAEGNYQASIGYAERAFDLVRRWDCPASSHALFAIHLGRSRLLAGDPPAEVHPLFFEAFEWATQTRSPMIVALSLECLAETVTTSDPDGAARLLGAAAGILKTHGLVLDEPDRAYDEHVMLAVEARLGQQRTNELMGSAADLSLDQAMLLGRALTE